jgi:hypothetical protein
VKVIPKKSQAKTTDANRSEPGIDLEQEIRCRAYELYEWRGREDGHEVEDWLQAEAELMRERNTPLTATAVKRKRKPPVASTGETKAKQVRKSKLSAQNKTLEETRNGN